MEMGARFEDFEKSREDEEEVHHLDLNPENNDRDNLVVLDKEFHHEIHRELSHCHETTFTSDLSFCPSSALWNLSHSQTMRKIPSLEAESKIPRDL